MSKTDQPLIDINIITYQNMPGWPEVLQRVQNQTYDNIRINIIDDHSADGTYEYSLEAAKKDSRIHIHRNAVNTGIIPNYQRAYWWGETDYVMLKSADDWIEPTYLERIMDKMLANPKIGQCSTLAHSLNSSFQIEESYTAQDYMRTNVDDIIGSAAEVMMKYGVGPPYWGVYRRDVLEKCLEFGYYAGSDHVFLCEVALYGSIDYVEEYLFKRVGGGKTVDFNACRLSLFHVRKVNLDSKFADLKHMIPIISMLYYHYDMFTKAKIEDKYRVPLMLKAQSIFGQRYGSTLIAEAQRLCKIADMVMAQVGQDTSPNTVLLNKLYLERLLDIMNKTAVTVLSNVDMKPTCERVLKMLHSF